MEYGLNPLIIFYLGKLFRQKMDAKSILEPIFTLITPGAPPYGQALNRKMVLHVFAEKIKEKEEKRGARN